MRSCTVHAEWGVKKRVALCRKQQRHVLVCHNVHLQVQGIQENIRLIRRYVGENKGQYKSNTTLQSYLAMNI